jgi:putative endonuclease
MVYYEKFPSISKAYFREKQIQKWTKAKKEALINGDKKMLSHFSACKMILIAIIRKRK